MKDDRYVLPDRGWCDNIFRSTSVIWFAAEHRGTWIDSPAPPGVSIVCLRLRSPGGDNIRRLARRLRAISPAATLHAVFRTGAVYLPPEEPLKPPIRPTRRHPASVMLRTQLYAQAELLGRRDEGMRRAR
jgi:hypothetical protein